MKKIMVVVMSCFLVNAVCAQSEIDPHVVTCEKMFSHQVFKTMDTIALDRNVCFSTDMMEELEKYVANDTLVDILKTVVLSGESIPGRPGYFQSFWVMEYKDSLDKTVSFTTVFTYSEFYFSIFLQMDRDKEKTIQVFATDFTSGGVIRGAPSTVNVFYKIFHGQGAKKACDCHYFHQT